jgi:hypothetical protein
MGYRENNQSSGVETPRQMFDDGSEFFPFPALGIARFSRGFATELQPIKNLINHFVAMIESGVASKKG